MTNSKLIMTNCRFDIQNELMVVPSSKNDTGSPNSLIQTEIWPIRLFSLYLIYIYRERERERNRERDRERDREKDLIV